MISAYFPDHFAVKKVPLNLQIETSWWQSETSSKFSYHIPVGLFCIFEENELADWLRGLTSKQW